ncbi:hypothetical protein VOLCADRAFT_93679 [Volvox carteri f. nagariensis]|uniref:Uncharacterized protein n=1 Tax=Volvox carteri f. nagariensis TaxID=3068 RepID=D8U2R6_VOLCA|nr:uncharacterized protein VOLCADRAFT_93679 [Volvox carteri f. nagariensis]EFJ45945.1 hypothetical protein VOLCADRAFT_93679 [Volvox carteri f. nagariensis]|eukprot:XP_002953023.1 hypothetical protein VOLCADRAFT_93679 [Volvox carteri f. nagariensis]
MATLNEALGLIDDVAQELKFYDAGIYKQLQEQTSIHRCRDILERVKTAIMARDADGNIRADSLATDDWRKIANLVAPLARCFTVSSPPVTPSSKTRHSSAVAVAALALLSSCGQKSKIIVNSALESGVVDAFVNTLRTSLRNPVSDRVIKAMLYKIIEALWGFSLYANTQLQQELVAHDVVNICLDLITSSSVEVESKINANKTLYNFLNGSNGRVVTELRSSKIAALNGLLQQQASQVPEPAAAGALALAGGTSGKVAITMPALLPHIMSWIWFLPHYILDHLMQSLAGLMHKLVVLVWPEGCPGLPLLPSVPATNGPNRQPPPPPQPQQQQLGSPKPRMPSQQQQANISSPSSSAVGPLQVAQVSLPNRTFQKLLQAVFRTISSGLADARLVALLRGTSCLAAAAGGPDSGSGADTHSDIDMLDADGGAAAAAGGGGSGGEGDEDVHGMALSYGGSRRRRQGQQQGVVQPTALPARLVRVVREGRSDGMETRVALEILDELFACDAKGEHPELADDALAAGLLKSMSEMGVLQSLNTEGGMAAVSAYVRLCLKLIRRVPYTPGLASWLHDSGVPASLAYVSFWPTSRLCLKLDALQTLNELVQVDTDMTEHVVTIKNFPAALANTLLGGDPDSKKSSKKSGWYYRSKKKGSSSAAAVAAAAAAAAAAADAVHASGITIQAKSHRDQIPEAALNILNTVLDESRESDKVWETVIESGMLPRLLQHCGDSSMPPGLLVELLLAVGLTFKDHGEDAATVGPLQAACAPHLLPLLTHESAVVASTASRLLCDILFDMARYRSGSTDVAEGDDILKALVAAGPAIDTADAAAAAAAAAKVTAAALPTAAAAAAAAATAVKDEEAGGGGRRGGASPGGLQRPARPDVDAVGVVGVCGEEAVSPEGAVTVLDPGAVSPVSTAAAESPGGSVQGDGMMEVDAATTTANITTAYCTNTGTAAPAASASAAPADAGTAAGAVGNSGTTGSGAATTAAATALPAAAAAAAAAPPGRSGLEGVNVTSQGLCLISTAIQTCTRAVLRRVGGTSSPALTQTAVTVTTTTTAAASPSGKASGRDKAATAAAAAAPAAVLEGPSYNTLEALLQSCRVLCEACLQMPAHGAVRRHIARAFAYARPAVDELVAGLTALPNSSSGQMLLREAREVLQVLRRVPVLDVASLPQLHVPPAPAVHYIVKTGEAPVPASATIPAKKGLPLERARSSTVATDTADADAIKVKPDRPGGGVAKRADSVSAPAAPATAAAAAAVATAAAAVKSPNGGATRPSVRKGQRRDGGATEVAAAADGLTGGDCTGSVIGGRPRRGQSRSVVSAAAKEGRGLADGAAGAAVSSGASGAAAASGGRDADVAANPEKTDRKMDERDDMALVRPGLVPAVDASTQMGISTAAAAALQEYPSCVPLELRNSFGAATGSLAALGSVTATTTTMMVTTAAKVEAGVGAGTAGPAVADDRQGAGGFPGGVPGGAAAAAAGKSRVNPAEIRARYLELKAQNARMAAELAELRRAKEDVEAVQQRTAATLSSRTEELARVLQELEEKDQELEDKSSKLDAAQEQLAEVTAALQGRDTELKDKDRELEAAGQQLAHLTADLQEAQGKIAKLEAAVAGATGGLQQLKSENADLRAELAGFQSLADLE